MGFFPKRLSITVPFTKKLKHNSIAFIRRYDHFESFSLATSLAPSHQSLIVLNKLRVISNFYVLLV